MDLKYKIALVVVPALLVFSGVGYAAYHDGVFTAKDVSEVEAADTGNELTIKGTVVWTDEQSLCNMAAAMSKHEAEEPMSCFVLESTDDNGTRTWALVTQSGDAPKEGETAVAKGVLRLYYDVASGEYTYDAFGMRGEGSEKEAGQMWGTQSNPYAGFAPGALMWLDATTYHGTWIFG